MGIIIDLLDANIHGKKMRRRLFELIIMDDIFLCSRLFANYGKANYGERTAFVLGELIKKKSIMSVNDIFDMIYFHQEIIGNGFIGYFNNHMDRIDYLKEHTDELNSVVNITIEKITEKCTEC